MLMMTETEYRNAVDGLRVDDSVKAKLHEAYRKNPEMASHTVGMAQSFQNGDVKGMMQHSADLKASVRKQVGGIMSTGDKNEVGDRATHQLLLEFLDFFKMIIELLEQLFYKFKDEFEKLASKAPGVKQAEGVLKTMEHAIEDLKEMGGKLMNWMEHPVQTAESAGEGIAHGVEHLMGFNTEPEPPGSVPKAPKPY